MIRRLSIGAGLLLALGSGAAVQPVWYYSHFAGTTGGDGYRDGTGQEAKFSYPSGIAFDKAGNAYVCDQANAVIRKVTPGGVVTTWVGVPGVSALVDGNATAARFLGPGACAFDAGGTLYVADAMTVRKISPDGQVSTLAGSATPGSADGTGSAAGFRHLAGLAVDATGTVYVSDLLSATIRKITSAGVVTTLAGSAGSGGTSDGVGAAARFQEVRGLTLTPTGDLVVVDGGLVRKVTSAGVVSTLAGVQSSPSDVDGALADARFWATRSIAADAEGNLYLMTYYYVRKITIGGQVVTLAGSSTPGVNGRDGSGSGASFVTPDQIAFGPDGALYVTENSPGRIRRVTLAGVVTTLAGGVPASGSADGTGGAARFNRPGGAEVDSVGNLYVADTANHTIRKITPAGVVTTFAGAAGQAGSADGPALSARFKSPTDVTVDDDGTVYVLDRGNHTVRKISAAGAVTTLAGTATPGDQYGDDIAVDGVGPAAHFNSPAGISSDGHGTVYVCEPIVATIRKITSVGTVTTLAGSGQWGYADGTGAAAQFSMPSDLAVDRSTGDIYVADFINFRIRKVTPAGVVTTLAGGQGGPAPVDGTGPDAVLFSPSGGIGVDAAGNVLFHDYGLIRKATPDGVVTTIGGKVFMSGNASGVGTAARFSTGLPGLTVNRATGEFYISDNINNTIRKASLVTPAITWSQPAAITYGTALSAVQLNATTNIDGDYTVHAYSPAAGTQLEAGTHTLSVTSSVPSFSAVPQLSTSVTLTVNPATPTLAWSSPASIAFGTKLSGTQLNATSPVEGTFTYSPATGALLEMGTHELSVTFTPKDGKNYTTATARVSLVVTAAQLAGTYFGTFGKDGGRWALLVNSDNTARFIGYLASRHSAIVLTLTIGADGTFSTSGSELTGTASSGAVFRTFNKNTGDTVRLAAAGFTLSGRIVGSALTADLGGLADTLTGIADRAPGNAAAGVYQAVALNAGTGESDAIVAASGQAVVVVVSAAGADGAAGTLGGDGRASLTTATGGRLDLTIGSAGSFSAAVTPVGSTTVKFSGLADGVVSTSRPVNIATRAYCETDDRVTIGGFVVEGSGPKKFLIRAVGPTLGTLGIPAADVLKDPFVEVHDSRTNAIIATNDNWGDNANAAQIPVTAQTVGATALAGSDAKSAALLLSMNPGVYTFVVKGQDGGSGIVLLEVYDAETANLTAKFMNIATRAYVKSGDRVAIGGFVVIGNAPKRVLVRAVGPTLGKYGLKPADLLADPVLELHDSMNDNAIITSNDDWGTNGNAAAIVTTGARIGATAIDASDTNSAALLLTLAPGVYTAIAKGKDDSSGIVLVEVYDAD